MNNEKKRRHAERRRLCFSIAAAVIALAGAALFFLPFVTFRLGKMNYTFTSLQVVTGYINVNGTAVSLPVIAKIAAAVCPPAFLAGGVLILLKKPRSAAGCFMLAAIAPLAVMMTGNSASSTFLDLGVSRVEMSYHAAMAGMLAAGLLAAVLSMATKGADRLAESVFLVFACMSVGAVAIITIYMIAAGTPAIAEIGLGNFLFGTEWAPSSGKYGILYMILTSVFGTLGAILIGVPVGLFTAIFLAELAPRRLAAVVRPAVELLAGIPSVIYGFFGMIIIIPAIQAVFPNTFGYSLLAMILILAIMVLPTIVNVSETALRAVPVSYKEASLALGNTHIGTIFKVLVPAAKSGILAGVILGVGRAIGETMAVIMVCGNVVQFPQLLQSVRPLTAGVVLEMSYSYGLHRQALFSIGLVLFVFIMIVNISFTMISRRGVKIDGRE
ncbi:MAG TPA: phosphate ABC transporter permease subunit PstC [Firmicutes bacterium]|nr:phosphate ABC transporter permease subunit PstC [Bacillota bacterium]